MRNGAGLELLHQVEVLDGGDGVADALGTNCQRLADGLGPGSFAGVVGQAEAGRFCLLGIRVALNGSEPARRSSPPRPTPTMEGQLRPHFGSLEEDPLRLGDAEVADGVEDPVKREAQLALAAFAGAFQAGKDGLQRPRGRGCGVM
jgi:hypothetical protein